MAILNALLPVFICIAIGFVIKRRGFPGDDLWAPLNALGYYIFFPALLFGTLATSPFDGEVAGKLGGTLVAAQLSMALILTIIRRIWRIPGPAYSSVFQGAVRWNGFVALAIIAALYGDEGITIAAIAFAFMVPTANVLSVFALTRHAANEPATLRTVISLLARNPLILSCLAGATLNVAGITLPTAFVKTLDVLGAPALPIGLLGVGAALTFTSFKVDVWLVTLTTVLKLLAMPAIIYGLCLLMGVTGLPLVVAMTAGAVPGASASYILARELGGDAELMAALITASTLAAAITMPIILYVAI